MPDSCPCGEPRDVTRGELRVCSHCGRRRGWLIYEPYVEQGERKVQLACCECHEHICAEQMGRRVAEWALLEPA